MKKAYLAFDLGAESGRAMLGILEDGQLTLHEAHRFLNLPKRLPDGWHWDTTGLWGNLIEGLKKGAALAEEHGLTLTSIGVDTWGVDFGLLGRSGQLLGLPFVYRDERNPPAMDKVLAQLGEEALYAKTGIQFMPFNSLFQLSAQCKAEAGVLAIADRLLFMPDLLHYFFTGEKVNEASIASTSQLLDLTGDHPTWAVDVLKELGIPTGYLGEIVKPGTEVGTLLKHVAEEAQVSDEIKVIAPAGHDTASAFAAAPAEADAHDWLIMSSGTWSLMGAELDVPVLTEKAREAGFTNEGGVNGTIRFLTNIMGLWLVQETRRAFEERGEVYDYVQLTQMASEAEAFRTLVNPNHGPFLHPKKMLEKIDHYAEQTGQPKPETVGQYVRCCLESLALTYKHTAIQMKDVLEREFSKLHLVGGGGKNELLDQMTADATGLDVIVGPYEATAAGNLLVQAMGAGDVKDLTEIREIIKASFEPKTFSPTDTDAWDQAYERYLELIATEVAE